MIRKIDDEIWLYNNKYDIVESDLGFHAQYYDSNNTRFYSEEYYSSVEAVVIAINNENIKWIEHKVKKNPNIVYSEPIIHKKK